MTVPSYRAIPGTNPQFLVDAFRYRPIQQDKVYFLTHAHSDHYGGLTENWSGGPIYCSEVTARLVLLLTGIPVDLLRPVPMDVTIRVHGVAVTFIDANHCPGAAQVLFELPDGRRYIHCGDMRYSTKLLDNPHLQRFKNADAVFLDNTYAHPRHAFPPQEEAVEFVASHMHQLLQEDEAAGQDTAAASTLPAVTQPQPPPPLDQQHQAGVSVVTDREQQVQPVEAVYESQQQAGPEQQQQQQQQEVVAAAAAGGDDDDIEEQQQAQQQLGFRRLYMISTYVIGKERLLLAVAARTGRKLLVTQRKLRLLRATGLSSEELDATFTTDPTASPIRVVRWGHLGDTWPYFRPNFTNMEADRTAAAAQEVVGFVPTGWTYEMRKAAAAGGPYPFPVRTKAACSVWLIPYSEHSSFPELREYVGYLKPKQIIPTVGVGADGPENDKKVTAILKHFRGLLDETANKAAFIARLGAATAIGPKRTTSGRMYGTAGDNGNLGAGARAAGAAGGAAEVVDLAGDGQPDYTNTETAAGAPAASQADDDEGFWELPADVAAAATADGLAPAAHAAASPTDHQLTALADAGSSRSRQGTCAAPAGDAEAASVVAAGEDAGAGVQVLQSIAAPGILTAAEAQRLLAAASGNLNAAVNVLLDKQSRQQQQQQQQRKSPAALAGKKRSRGGNSGAAAAAGAGSSSSKKARQQHKSSPSVPGQAAITSFFSANKATPKQQQQQQQQQQQATPQQEQQLPSPGAALQGSLQHAPARQDGPSLLQQQQQQVLRQQGGAQHGDETPGASSLARAVSPTAVVLDGVSKVLLPPLRKHTTRQQSVQQQQQQQQHQHVQGQQPSRLQQQQWRATRNQVQQSAGGQQQHPVPWPSLPPQQQQQQQQPHAQTEQPPPPSPPPQQQQQQQQQQRHEADHLEAEPAVKVVLPSLPRRPAPGTKQCAAAAGAAGVGDAVGSTDVYLTGQSGPTPVQQPQQQQQQQQQQAAFGQGPDAAACWQALLPGNRPQHQTAENTPSTAGKQFPVPGHAVAPTLAADKPSAAAAAAGAPAAPAGAGPGSSSLSVTSTADVVPAALRQAALLPLQRYHPLDHAVWSAGQSAPYLALALALSAVDGTSKRNQMALGMTNFFRSLMLLSPGDVVPAAYLLCGRIGPEYVSSELNIGGSVVSSALCEVCGVSRSQLRELYKQLGDLGDVAQACRRKQTLLQAPAPLTITGFFETLHKLRGMSGQGANARRQAVVSKLLRSARDVETRYLVRTLIMCLRVGAGYRSVLPPLAKAALLHRSMLLEAASKDATAAAAADGSAQPTAAAAAAAAACAASSVSRVSKAQLDAASAAVLAAYHRCPNIQIIADVLMTHGPEALEQQVQLSCGVPVKPMLARPCTGAADALKLLSSTAAAGAVAASKGRVKQATAAAAAAGLSAGDLAESAMELLMCDSDSSGGNELGFDEADDGSADSGGEAGTAADTAADTAAGGALAWQQAGSGAVAGSSSSSSSLWLLAEFKYDGQRAQIHVTAEREVRIFSRNCEEHTASFPDVCGAILAALDPSVLPVVLDTELVAVDRADGNRLRAFQELATRRRGTSSTAAAAAAGDGGGDGGGGRSSGSGSVAKGAKRPAVAACLASVRTGKGPQQQKLKLQATPSSSTQLSAASTEGAAAASAGATEAPFTAEQQQQRQQGGQVVPSKSVTAGPGQGQGQEAVDVCVFVFDALCVGGRDLMAHSLRERRAAAAAVLITLTPGVVQLAQGIEVQAGTELLHTAPTAAAAATMALPNQAAAAAGAGGAGAGANSWAAADQQLTEYLFTALDAGCEGLMLKLLDGPASGYTPAQRGLSWLKLKRDYLEGLADSLDLVPIGAWHGQGRKVKWFSPFLLAVYDRQSESFQSLCRVMSGFTDEFYAAAKDRLSASIIPGPKPYYNTGESPSVWFEPTEVWEVRGADLSISPVHRAAVGLIHPERGIGLRFPRFLRIRSDKSPEDASGPDLVQQLYNKQNRRVHHD